MVIFIVKSLKLIRKLSKVLLNIGLVYKIIKNLNVFLQSRNSYNMWFLKHNKNKVPIIMTIKDVQKYFKNFLEKIFLKIGEYLHVVKDYVIKTHKSHTWRKRWIHLTTEFTSVIWQSKRHYKCEMQDYGLGWNIDNT